MIEWWPFRSVAPIVINVPPMLPHTFISHIDFSHSHGFCSESSRKKSPNTLTLHSNLSVPLSRKPLYISLVVSFRDSLTTTDVMNLVIGLHLGVETIIVGETISSKSDRPDTTINPSYLVGLKNPIYTYLHLTTHVGKGLSPYIVGEPKFVKRRGWKAVCAMFPETECNIILWGISEEEFLARKYASTKKISLYMAKAIISRAGYRNNISQLPSTYIPSEPNKTTKDLPSKAIEPKEATKDLPKEQAITELQATEDLPKEQEEQAAKKR